MAPQARPDSRSHRPSNVLRFYCAAFRAQLESRTTSDPAWCYREAEILRQGAQELLAAANHLEARGHASSQPSLPLDDAAPPHVLDFGALQKRFPYLAATDGHKFIDAYERITQLAPSIVLYPDVLHAEIRNQLETDELDAAAALGLLNFEHRVRTLHQTSTEIHEHLVDFGERLRARLTSLYANEALNETGFEELVRFLDDSLRTSAPF